MKIWVLLSCLTLVAAQSPTCNDVRTILAAKDCCQLTSDEPSVDDFVWRSCTLTVPACAPGDILVRSSNNAVAADGTGEGYLWKCIDPHLHLNTRRLNEQYDQQLEELRYRVLKLEEQLRIYKE